MLVMVNLILLTLINNIYSFKGCFKQVFISQLTLNTAIESFIDIGALDFGLELIFLFMFIFVGAICFDLLCSKSEKGRFYERLLYGIEMALVILSLLNILVNFSRIDWHAELYDYLYSIVYLFGMFLFMYSLCLYDGLLHIYKSMNSSDSKFNVIKNILLPFVLHFDLKKIRHFKGEWPNLYAGCQDMESVRNCIKDYKNALCQTICNEREKEHIVEDCVGVARYNEKGIWLDRTELKNIMMNFFLVASYETNHYKSYGLYTRDIPQENIYQGNGTNFEVHFNLDMTGCIYWYTNPSGFCYAIKLTEGYEDYLFFEGESYRLKHALMRS